MIDLANYLKRYPGPLLVTLSCSVDPKLRKTPCLCAVTDNAGAEQRLIFDSGASIRTLNIRSLPLIKRATQSRRSGLTSSRSSVVTVQMHGRGDSLVHFKSVRSHNGEETPDGTLACLQRLASA